ncbi:hypothetical protein RLIN73S_06498 [Rhodanobacter lindaniclasticus]
MARRLVSEGLLPEDDVRKAMADSAQQKVPLGAWLLDRNLGRERPVDPGAVARSSACR